MVEEIHVHWTHKTSMVRYTTRLPQASMDADKHGSDGKARYQTLEHASPIEQIDMMQRVQTSKCAGV